MIMKTLFSGVVGLAFVLNHASAQYQTNHQQVFFFEDPNRRVFDTKAFTPVEEKQRKKLKWAFASTISSDDQSKLNILLVKLRENLPESSAYGYEWAYEYGKDGISIDVEDVHYEVKGKKTGYILCGQVTKKGGQGEGFLFRADVEGNIISVRTYPQISSFKSVVPWHNGNGYIAVGKTQFPSDPDAEDQSRDAAYVSVKKNLKEVCALSLEGYNPEFQQLGYVDDGFNKVIKYEYKSKPKTKMYAVVGETTQDYNKCRNNTDVMVAVADEKCNVKFVKQYGSPKNNEPEVISERGLSIARMDKGKGRLIITGNTKSVIDCQEVRFDDVLVFRIDPDGNLDWMGHYDLEPSPFVLPNIGTAVAMTTLRKETTKILIAGETTTTYFPNDTKPSPPPVTKDAFLLEIKAGNGNVNVAEVFGSYKDVDNGALFPGNLDLHLTRDHHAVIMGNSKIPDAVPNKNHPYLIERYRTIEDRCQDIEIKVKKQKYEFVHDEIKFKSYDIKAKGLKLEKLERRLKQGDICKKIESSDPTPFPTKPPTPKPTFESEPPISKPPTPKPTFETEPPISKPPTPKPTFQTDPPQSQPSPKPSKRPGSTPNPKPTPFPTPNEPSTNHPKPTPVPTPWFTIGPKPTPVPTPWFTIGPKPTPFPTPGFTLGPKPTPFPTPGFTLGPIQTKSPIFKEVGDNIEVNPIIILP